MVSFLSSRRFLAVYSGCLTVVFAMTVFCGFAKPWQSANFDQITVHRINVVEPDGTVRLILADKAQFPGNYLHGKEARNSNRDDSAGLLFVNDEGTEDGGLIYGGKRDAAGKPSSFSHLSFDQYDQDQTLVFGASLNGGKRASGVWINDVGDFLFTPEYLADGERWKAMAHGDARAAAYAALVKKYPVSQERGFFGRQRDDSVGMSLSDTQGHERLVLKVNADGEPVLRFLDAAGKVTREIAGDK